MLLQMRWERRNKQMRKQKWTPKKIHTYLRALIQLLFFLFLPSAFTTAFSGIKTILTQIGSGSPVAMSAFLTVLLALCAYTIVFGRFFCGYACAFGTLGDAVHAGYLFLCKKAKKKPLLLKKSWQKLLSYLKYVILLAIVLLCFFGVYGNLRGFSPWDVFSMIRAGNFHLSGYLPGLLLLLLILAWSSIQYRSAWCSVNGFFAGFCALWVLCSICCRFCRCSLFAAKRQIVQRDAVPAPGAVRLSFLCRNPAALL